MEVPDTAVLPVSRNRLGMCRLRLAVSPRPVDSGASELHRPGVVSVLDVREGDELVGVVRPVTQTLQSVDGALHGVGCVERLDVGQAPTPSNHPPAVP